MFNFGQLTHLSIQCPDFGQLPLVELLDQLPHADALTLYAKTSYLDDEHLSDVERVSSRTRIRHVTVRGRCSIRQVCFVTHLCPRVQSLEIEIDEEQLESIVRCCLAEKTSTNDVETAKTRSSSLFKEFDVWQRKLSDFFARTPSKTMPPVDSSTLSAHSPPINNDRLCSLCFVNPHIGMEQKLHRLIQREKLIDDFLVGSLFNALYLWW
jgi:hypothetical protein